MLVAVEDAHWIDHPTREVMMFILMRLRVHDLRAIFARRPLTATERVTPGINMVEVGPLDDEAAGRLLDLLHPGLPESVRGRVLAEAAGNPLAITELPQTSVGVELLPSGTPLRTRLETAFAGRVLSLDPRVRTTLLVTALDGDRLEHRAELSPHDLIEVERLEPGDPRLDAVGHAVPASPRPVGHHQHGRPRRDPAGPRRAGRPAPRRPGAPDVAPGRGGGRARRTPRGRDRGGGPRGQPARRFGRWR